MKAQKTARQSWDTWIATMHGHLLTWKIMAIALAAALIITMGFSGYYYTRPKYLPYVVYISDSGDVDYKGLIETDSINVTSALMHSYLIRFVSDLAKVSTDLAVHKQMLSDAYYLATPAGQQILTDYIVDENILEQAATGDGEVSVDIRFLTFDQLAEATWRVEWEEIERRKGILTDRRERVGTFTYSRRDATSMEEAEKNPAGIYFDSFLITDSRR